MISPIPFAIGVVLGWLIASYVRYRRKTKGFKVKISLKALYSLSAIAPRKWLVGGIEHEYGNFLYNDRPFWLCGKNQIDGTIYYSPHEEGIRCADEEEFSVLRNRRDDDELMRDCIIFKLPFFDYMRLRLAYRTYVWRMKRRWKQKKASENVASEWLALKLAYESILNDIEKYHERAHHEFTEAADLSASVASDSAGEPYVDLDELREQMKPTNSVLH